MTMLSESDVLRALHFAVRDILDDFEIDREPDPKTRSIYYWLHFKLHGMHQSLYVQMFEDLARGSHLFHALKGELIWHVKEFYAGEMCDPSTS